MRETIEKPTAISTTASSSPKERDAGLARVRRTRTGLDRETGFTLIEIMIVLAIIAGVLAIGAPRLFSTATQMRGTVRKMSVMTREIRNNARLFNTTTRLALSMDNEKGHSFWIESAPGNAKLLTEDQQKELDRLTTSQREDESPKSQFQPDTRVMKKPESLPRGMFFESVEFGNRSEAVTTGKAYIHFFPQGLSEEAAIHLTDRKTLNWTIVINPLTGRADVYERKVSLKELN